MVMALGLEHYSLKDLTPSVFEFSLHVDLQLYYLVVVLYTLFVRLK